MSDKLGLLAIALASVTFGTAASETPLWLRDAAISPDGTRIAFTYKGDIFVVPASGGEASRLTSNAAYDHAPFWSPDGTKITFASDREGSDDVFIIASGGGTPLRLTSDNVGAEVPQGFIDDNTVLFSASSVPAMTASQGPFQGQVYTVADVPGSRPEMYLSIPMTTVDVNRRDGRLIYQNRKGYEDVLRKHERSSGTPDVWVYDPSHNSFTQLTDFNGANQNPVWRDDSSFFYLNDKDGNNNIWLRSFDGSERQLTHFKDHPVRSLSSSSDAGILAFSQNGELFTFRPGVSGAEPVKVSVTIATDNYDPDLVKKNVTAGASNLAVAPDGKEVAIVLRGDIFVTSTEYDTTRRLTSTQGQERCLDYAPDGHSIVYDSERDGLWRLYISSLAPADTIGGFVYAPEVTEKLLYESQAGKPAQQPLFSPDGKKVAFLEDRTAIKVIDVASGKVTTVLDPSLNYSYTDGDVAFAWSPDSRWLLASYIGDGRWNNSDIALVDATGEKDPVDLTLSGYSDNAPAWTPDGGGFTYLSGKNGYRSHGSWGEQTNVFMMMLDPEKWERFKMTEEELALEERVKKDTKDDSSDPDKKGDKKKKGKKDDAKWKKEESKPLDFDLDNRFYRIACLTPVPGFIGDYAVSPKTDRIYYSEYTPEDKYDLMMTDLKKKSTSRLLSDVNGGFILDKKGEKLYVLSGDGIQCVTLPQGDGGSASVKPITYNAEYSRVPSEEREYMYDHVVSQVRDKFYDVNIHGVDWEKYGKEYRRFLPHISNNRDFAILLSELLGELNASHTGGRAYTGSTGAARVNASLGAFFDPSYKGDGLKISEILGEGPLALPSAALRPGDVIKAIDGVPVLAGKDYLPLLEGKAGKKVRLTVDRASGKGDSNIYVRPVSAREESNMLYHRFVERNRHIVDSISGGKVGYVHVQGMNSPSFRTVYDELLGRHRNCEAVVVDTRYNGGGWLHNDIAILLSGKEYVRFSPRGQYIGSEPFSQWTKPSVMLINESNYSDAHGTPYVYKTLGIGKLVGAPVPGTMTAVWWENMIDPSIVFGIPQVTSLDMNGKPLENQQLDPDILVYNNPGDVLKGIDAQLIEATRELLRQIEQKK